MSNLNTDITQWIECQISTGRLIRNAGIGPGTCYMEVLDLIGGIGNAHRQGIAAAIEKLEILSAKAEARYQVERAAGHEVNSAAEAALKHGYTEAINVLRAIPCAPFQGGRK